MVQERRRNPRFACDLDATLEIDGATIPCRAADISASGICVHAEVAAKAGSRAIFHVRLILEKAESDTLALPGTVVWCTPTRANHQIGARFDASMESWRKDKLALLLRFLAGELTLDPGQS